MPRVQEHPEHPEGGRKYGAHQIVSPVISCVQAAGDLCWRQEIYRDGILHNRLPTVTYDSNKLEEQAKKFLGARSFNYVAGGAGERATMDANRLAFRQWKVEAPDPLLATAGFVC